MRTTILCIALLSFFACNENEEAGEVETENSSSTTVTSTQTRSELLLTDAQQQVANRFQLPAATVFHDELSELTTARMNDSAFLAMVVYSLPEATEGDNDTLYGIYMYVGGDSLDMGSYRFVQAMQK